MLPAPPSSTASAARAGLPVLAGAIMAVRDIFQSHDAVETARIQSWVAHARLDAFVNAFQGAVSLEAQRMAQDATNRLAAFAQATDGINAELNALGRDMSESTQMLAMLIAKDGQRELSQAQLDARMEQFSRLLNERASRDAVRLALALAPLEAIDKVAVAPSPLLERWK